MYQKVLLHVSYVPTIHSTWFFTSDFHAFADTPWDSNTLSIDCWQWNYGIKLGRLFTTTLLRIIVLLESLKSGYYKRSSAGYSTKFKILPNFALGYIALTMSTDNSSMYRWSSIWQSYIPTIFWKRHFVAVLCRALVCFYVISKTAFRSRFQNKSRPQNIC